MRCQHGNRCITRSHARRGVSRHRALSDPEQNNRIGRLCRQRGVLFNNADGEPGDVILPSVSRGYLLYACHQHRWQQPAVSRFIREHLEHEFPTLDQMIALQQRLRAELKKAEPDQGKRNAILREVPMMLPSGLLLPLTLPVHGTG